MSCTYKKETFAEVMTWMEGTLIKYAPNPKSGKSFHRYAQYEKARTVGESLRLGSYGVDLLFDYEKGHLWSVGGPKRERPPPVKGVSKEDLAKYCKTDSVLGKMYENNRLWSANFQALEENGMTRQELKAANDEQGEDCGKDSIQIAIGRRKAQAEAAKILEAIKKEGNRKVTDGELLSCLRLWGFKENTNRGNVMPDGDIFVYSDTIGLIKQSVCERTLMTVGTKRYQEFTQLICKWLKDRMPPELKGKFCFTSVNINKNYAGRLHRDGNNLGPSLIKALGEFHGGELNYYPTDSGKGPLEALQDSERVSLNIQDHLLLFDGNRGHYVSDFHGERYTLVFFCVRTYAKVSAEDVADAKACGIMVPDEATAKKAQSLLGRGSDGYRIWRIGEDGHPEAESPAASTPEPVAPVASSSGCSQPAAKKRGAPPKLKAAARRAGAARLKGVNAAFAKEGEADPKKRRNASEAAVEAQTRRKGDSEAVPTKRGRKAKSSPEECKVEVGEPQNVPGSADKAEAYMQKSEVTPSAVEPAPVVDLEDETCGVSDEDIQAMRAEADALRAEIQAGGAATASEAAEPIQADQATATVEPAARAQAAVDVTADAPQEAQAVAEAHAAAAAAAPAAPTEAATGESADPPLTQEAGAAAARSEVADAVVQDNASLRTKVAQLEAQLAAAKAASERPAPAAASGQLTSEDMMVVDTDEPKAAELSTATPTAKQPRGGALGVGAAPAEATSGQQAAPKTETPPKQQAFSGPSGPSRRAMKIAAKAAGLAVGVKVKLVGLQQVPELNGLLGVISAWNDKRERWSVELDNGQGTKNLLMDNIVRAEPEEPQKVSEVRKPEGRKRQASFAAPVATKRMHQATVLRNVEAKAKMAKDAPKVILD